MSQLLGDMFSSKTPDDQDQLHQVDKAKKELAQYNAESVPDLDINPLEWWKVRQRTYPLLTKVVRKRFSMVATSVPSERLFSSAGNVINQKRSRLLPDNANKLVFLFENS